MIRNEDDGEVSMVVGIGREWVKNWEVIGII
jgi:hypothetical protein